MSRAHAPQPAAPPEPPPAPEFHDLTPHLTGMLRRHGRGYGADLAVQIEDGHLRLTAEQTELLYRVFQHLT